MTTFILMDEPLFSDPSITTTETGLHHAKANCLKKNMYLFKGGEYLCIYFFLCIYLFINPVITMVTAKANFVVARQTKSKEVDEQTASQHERTPAADDSGDFWQRRNLKLKLHSGKCLYLFSMNFCSITN